MNNMRRRNSENLIIMFSLSLSDFRSLVLISLYTHILINIYIYTLLYTFLLQEYTHTIHDNKGKTHRRLKNKKRTILNKTPFAYRFKFVYVYVKYWFFRAFGFARLVSINMLVYNIRTRSRLAHVTDIYVY